MEKQYLDYLRARSESADEILNSDEFKSLSQYPRHGFTNTFDHSVRVAVFMAWIAAFMHVSADKAVKTGLLHDFCFVDYYKKDNDHPGMYCFYHPEEAADNGNKQFGLTKEQQKAIRAHMFPLTVHLPASRLAWTLIMADKSVALYEVLYGFRFVRKYGAAIAHRKTAQKSKAKPSKNKVNADARLKTVLPPTASSRQSAGNENSGQ